MLSLGRNSVDINKDKALCKLVLMLILQRWQHLRPLMELNHLKLLLNHQLAMPQNQNKK